MLKNDASSCHLNPQRFLHVSEQSKGMTFSFSGWYKLESCFDMWFSFFLDERDYTFAYKGEKRDAGFEVLLAQINLNHKMTKNKEKN